jgi:serine/threonine protein kinase
MIVIIVSIGLRLMENRSRLGEMQMRRIVSKYELGDMLGRGAYSEVFLARHLEDGKPYAIKVISNRVLA